jgi:hypothetical protein
MILIGGQTGLNDLFCVGGRDIPGDVRSLDSAIGLCANRPGKPYLLLYSDIIEKEVCRSLFGLDHHLKIEMQF